MRTREDDEPSANADAGDVGDGRVELANGSSATAGTTWSLLEAYGVS